MKHLSHYLMLTLILTLGTVSILLWRFHPILRPLSILTTCAAYVIWGLFHHLSTGTLHRQVVLEYLSLSLLGGVIISLTL